MAKIYKYIRRAFNVTLESRECQVDFDDFISQSAEFVVSAIHIASLTPRCLKEFLFYFLSLQEQSLHYCILCREHQLMVVELHVLVLFYSQLKQT